MHFEILVEDQSGMKALKVLVPKIVDGAVHTFKFHPYKGVGHIPKKGAASKGVGGRLLLNNLPALLRGYGNAHANYPADYPAAVVVVCDLDDKDRDAFHNELLDVLNKCNPKPDARFCFAIEEGEAWFLGDLAAVKAAYPKARDSVLKRYENDAICGTWECLADAVYSGGATKLKGKGWHTVGREKSRWAEEITPQMDVEKNKSPSFKDFRETMRGLAEKREPNFKGV